MDSKRIIWLGMTIGTFIGGYLPVMWGGSTFSITSILLGAVGGVLGIIAGYKVTH